MQNKTDINQENRELENALSGLAPAQLSISQEQLMFKAGLACAKRRTAFWRSICAVLTAILGISLTLNISAQNQQGTPNPAYTTAAVHEQQKNFKSTKYSRDNSYIILRNKILREGLNALPKQKQSYSPTKPVSIKELLNDVV